MNPHMQGGPPLSPAVPMPHQSRRHQEYLQYQQHGPPRSPGPHNPYAAYSYPPQYYAHPSQTPYGMPRWQPHQASYPQYPMMQQPQYPPRSPLVVSSQPHVQQMSAATRPPPFSHVPFPPQSPHPAPPTPTMSIPQSVPSSHGPSSKPSTPQPPSRRSSTTIQPTPAAATHMPFYPELPWYSPPEARDSFPAKAVRRRKRRQQLHVANDAVALPSKLGSEEQDETLKQDNDGTNYKIPTTAAQSLQETPASSKVLLEDASPSAPKAETPERPGSSTSGSISAHSRKHTKTALPIVPAIPQIPRQKPVSPPRETQPSTKDANQEDRNEPLPVKESSLNEQPETISSPPTKAAPKSWADLVRSKKASAAAASNMNGSVMTNGGSHSLAGSIADVLSQFSVDNAANGKVQFLEPRGLVNTGNMCYMNSILQILVFCIPFYNFLDQVGKRAAHSFKSDTPLVDAMIMFMREYKVIDSAESADKLRMRLKDGELEQYGEQFIPEYVYDAIKRLPRFSSMRRGHQQDAEEFLGFLLEGLHDECVLAMRLQGVTAQAEGSDIVTSPTSATPQSADAGWLEVGPKQKAAVTRQSGDASTSSPITRIFGGALRSELRVPGLKNSVTLEPYQPLQLDIGAQNVNNITDALKGLTKPETLIGDFNSPRGPGTTATKQVFIETLPPMLILHLKRFQYDSSGGTQKIWKRIGYPLELEIPKEVCPPSKRGGLAVKGGLPRYRLNAVVYHHGKSAAGGHYTVDILRQDRREWVRVDDTLIRRIRPEDVAEGGAEEDPKILARALEQHKADQDSAKRNLFEGLDGEEEKTDDGKNWKEVNGVDPNKKKWAGIAAASTGTATPTTAGKQTPRKDNVKDNKVAYILLYEKISP